jgi:hypothetical protein
MPFIFEPFPLDRCRVCERVVREEVARVAVRRNERLLCSTGCYLRERVRKETAPPVAPEFAHA